MDQTFRKVTAGITAAVILITLFVLWPFAMIGTGERGVVLNFGAFQGEIMDPGLHLRIPVVQSVVRMNVQTQKFTIDKSECYSKDLQVVSVQSALNFNIDPKTVGLLYQNIGIDYEETIIRPRLEAVVKQTIAQYSAQELLEKRLEVQQKIQATISSELASSEMIVTQYALVNESFSQDYEAAIERKQIAQQDALTAENKKAQVQFEADQAVISAKAQAEAIKIKAEALRSNPALVQFNAVEKWNGILPTYMMGNSVPFLNLTPSSAK